MLGLAFQSVVCPMSPSVRYFLHLADPRGRGDRTEFIWAAVMVVAAQIAFALGLWVTNASVLGWRGIVANLVLGWLAWAAIAKRLHDLGCSSRWILGGFLAWVAGAIAVPPIAGSHALEMGTAGFGATLAALMLPPLGLALLLLLAKGEPAGNRYGPASAQRWAGLQPA